MEKHIFWALQTLQTYAEATQSPTLIPVQFRYSGQLAAEEVWSTNAPQFWWNWTQAFGWKKGKKSLHKYSHLKSHVVGRSSALQLNKNMAEDRFHKQSQQPAHRVFIKEGYENHKVRQIG